MFRVRQISPVCALAAGNHHQWTVMFVLWVSRRAPTEHVQACEPATLLLCGLPLPPTGWGGGGEEKEGEWGEQERECV